MKKLLSIILCSLLCLSLCAAGVSAADIAKAETLASDLKQLGLFKGVSDTDFALGRAPTRTEALVMLIRLLGKEEAALSGEYSHPFTDVEDWADKYVGYAFENGITKGSTQTTFGIGDANAQMYITFVLRALGYSDTNGEDFLWNNPYSLAEKVGILPSDVNRTNFLRADVVLISYAALNADIKGSSKSLAQRLINDGIFTYEKYMAVYDADSSIKEPKTELNAEQIYEKCAPAVFYIELYDKKGTLYAGGSGFFIDEDGTAVTNYHVIDGCYSAKVIVGATGEEYEVEGVYDYDKANDWAVIKVKGSGFSYIDIDSAASVTGGATVYAIGSPLGLENTISQGIISNPSRNIGNVPYIQITAPISHGSSGGVLLNKYGEAIGVTTAGFEGGENLGLAIPISLIQGYTAKKLTSLAQVAEDTVLDRLYNIVFPEDATKREKAFVLLETFIEVYSNLELSGKDAFVETTETEYGYYQHILVLGNNREITYIRFEVRDDKTYYTSIDFAKKGISNQVYYSWEKEKDGVVTAAFAGVSIINNTTFSRYSDFKFDNYEGANRYHNQDICKRHIVEALDFVNEVFEEFGDTYGSFSVINIGYESYF